MGSSPREEGQNQEEGEAFGVSKLWSQDRGPGCPGCSGVGLHKSPIDPIYLISPTPNALGFADSLFLEMSLS